MDRHHSENFLNICKGLFLLAIIVATIVPGLNLKVPIELELTFDDDTPFIHQLQNEPGEPETDAAHDPRRTFKLSISDETWHSILKDDPPERREFMISIEPATESEDQQTAE